MRKFGPVLIVMCLAALLLSACGAKASDPAAKAVEDYLNALVNKDQNKLSALSCAEWEQDALMELDSLQAVTAKLDNVTCKTTATSGDTSDVVCTGSIVATYNNENQNLDLSTKTYQVKKVGSDYLMCGYKGQ